MDYTTNLLTELAHRVLLAEEEHHDEEHHAHELEGSDSVDTLPLRITAIFVILAAGLLGGIPPMFLRAFRDVTSPLSCIVRAFAAGVILALALVHIIPEAVLEMNGLGGSEADKHVEDGHSEHEEGMHHARRLLAGGHAHGTFPYGGVTVVFGLVLMILLEHAAHVFFGGSHSHHSAMDPHHSESTTDAKLSKGSDEEEPVHTPVDHVHECVSRGPATNWATASSCTNNGQNVFRSKVLAVLFEFGCIFHSFIIGLALGVNTTGLSEVRALLIALAFHQWLEGISLASVVTHAGFAVWKRISMVVIYSLTCPVGIAIGIGIANTYDGESTTARAVQGTFNGVSGGMLLYISLVQLVAEDMGRVQSGHSSWKIRFMAYIGLITGAGLMCMLAVWA